MTPMQSREIEEILIAIRGLSSDERVRYLFEKLGGDESSIREVETLLEQVESSVSALEDSNDAMIGSLIGAYKIEREVGRGGMGTVYEAVRVDGEFRHRIAIKVVKRGMDTDFILKRFRNERKILAALDHPNIAHLLGGGTTKDGRPYFLMEFIDGKPLYKFCDDNKLNISQRLKLFCNICDAVQYAHQKSIVHRDLKPSNIIVSSNGIPTLLDFGISKLLGSDNDSSITEQTAKSMQMMTVEYASPEQVKGESVTFLSDVYSLGVILYELLTGCKPYRLTNRIGHEIARTITDDEPELPSFVFTCNEQTLPLSYVTEEAFSLASLAKMRSSTIENLQTELYGNLDNITLKALAKEQVKRYSSVASLHEDILRHLKGQPVSAPVYLPTTNKKQSNSDLNKRAESKLLAVLPFKLTGERKSEDTGDEYLCIGLADSLITRLSNVHRIVVRPTSSILRFRDYGSDPFKAGTELGVNYIIDGNIRRVGERIRVTVQLLNVIETSTQWASQFDENFTDVLQLEDSISQQVAEALIPKLTGDELNQLKKRSTENQQAFEIYLRGRHYWNTFNADGFAKALDCYNRAIAIDPQYALAYTGIADYYNWIGVYGIAPFKESSAAAKQSAQKAIELDPFSAEAYTALGFAVVCHDFDWATAESHHKRALELNPNYATAHQWYGFHLQMEGRSDEAISEMKRSIELDPLTPTSVQSLCWCLYQSRRYNESLEFHRKHLANEPFYGYGYLTYSWVLKVLGHHNEAIAAASKAIELSGENPFFLSALGSAYAKAGKRIEAENVLNRLNEMSKTTYVSYYHLALIHSLLGNKEIAIELLEKAFEIRDGWLVWLHTEPQLDSLRDDSRFDELLKLINHPKVTQ